MAAKIVVAGEDFIDIEVSSCFPLSSQTTQPGSEFEFHMSSSSFMNNIENEKLMMRSSSSAETMLASPADELFYKGKLLPLHLPPRLQMVEKLLQNSNLPHQKRIFGEEDDDIFSTPLTTTAKPTPTTTTCNTPLFESCNVSRELKPEEYVFEFHDFDQERKNNNNSSSSSSNKKSWTKKLMGSTLKASRAYLKSLFGKSSSLAGGGSCESYYAVSSTTKVADESSITNSKGLNNKNTSKSSGNSNNKKVPFGQIQRTSGNGSSSNSNRHRRSFSVGLKLMQSSSGGNNSKSSSSSSFLVGNKSSGFSTIHRGGGHDHHQKLKRCCSTNSDRENSIQGAIAHCKKSHEMMSDVVFSASARSVCDDQQQKRPEICRG